MQYKIPQNVGIEDKIVGPLTLRQIIILSVGIGMSYMLFLILNKVYELNVVEYVVIAIPALAAAAAALLKINHLSFPMFLILFLEYHIKPKKRAWDHRAIAPLIAPDIDSKKESEKTAEEAPSKKAINLRQLSLVLDSGGFGHLEVKEHADIDRAEDQDLVTQAFFGNHPSGTENMYWRSNKHDRGKRLDLLAKLPATSVKKQTPVATIPIVSEPKKIIVPTLAPFTPAPLVAPVQEALPKKKRRRRKKKNPEALARPDTHIDTTHKNQPVDFIPTPAPAPKPSSKKAPQGGEFEFKELEKGEIEINLD